MANTPSKIIQRLSRSLGNIGVRLVLGVVILVAIVVAGRIAYVNAINGGSTDVGGRRQAVANNNGLVAWYQFDGDTKDSSSNLNFATASGTITYSAGQFGQAATFGGSQSASVVNNSTLQNAAVTVAFWMNAAANSRNNEIVNVDGGTTGSPGFGVQETGAGTGAIMRIDTSSTANQTGCTISSTNGSTWNHIVYTISAGTVTGYQNGVQACTYSYTAGTGISNSSVPLYIGTGPGATHYTGKLDDLRLYNRVLSTDEITQIYQGNQPTNCDQTCLGWWKFDEGSGITAHDSTSQTGANLTDVNNTTSTTAKVGKGALFTAASSQYMSTGDPNPYIVSQNLSPGTLDYSISFWMRLNTIALSGLQYVIFNGASGNNEAGYDIRINSSGQLVPVLGDGTTRASCNSSALSTATWYHVVVVMNRAGNMQMFLNGSSSCTISISTYSATNILRTSGQFDIGGVGVAAEYIDGIVDEVGIWHRALTGAEVTDLYNSGSGRGLSDLTTAEKVNLATYWPMDELSSGSAPVSRYDALGGSTLYGFAFTPGTDGWTSGVFGGGLQFNGSTDYVDLGLKSAYTPSAALTVSEWVNWSAFTSGSGGYATVSNSGSAANGFAIYQNTSAPYNKLLSFIYTSVGGLHSITGSTLLSTGTWYHVVLTYDGSNVRLYVNGVQDGSAAATGTITTSTADLLFGSQYTSGGGKFTGTLDDVRIYNRALSSSEINDQYLAGR